MAHFCGTRNQSTYILICGDLEEAGEAAWALASLTDELLGLRSRVVVVAEGVEKRLAQVVHELIIVGVGRVAGGVKRGRGLQNVLLHLCFFLVGVRNCVCLVVFKIDYKNEL